MITLQRMDKYKYVRGMILYKYADITKFEIDNKQYFQLSYLYSFISEYREDISFESLGTICNKLVDDKFLLTEEIPGDEPFVVYSLKDNIDDYKEELKVFKKGELYNPI